MMKAVIIDDEPLNVRNLQALIEKYCQEVMVVGTAHSVHAGYELLTTVAADILFLDVLMPPHTGFDLLMQLPQPCFEIVFVTAYQEYGIQAIKSGALDYLLKPIGIAELQQATSKAMERIRQKRQYAKWEHMIQAIQAPSQQQVQPVALHLAHEIKLVSPADIVYLESDNSYTYVYLLGEQKPILVSTPIFEFEAMLADHRFVRTHQSWLVNLLHVKSILRKDGIFELLLTGGHLVGVSRMKRDLVKRLLLSK